MVAGPRVLEHMVDTVLYKGEERLPAEYTTPAEFRQIYRAFGYDEAASEDPNSLSYLYELDENTWLLMIDSCQYSPVNKVGGAVSEATYELSLIHI